MAFTLYSLIQTAILCTNAIAVLHEERFLSKIGWGVDQGVGGFGDDPGVKAQILHLIRSVRTVMRVGHRGEAGGPNVPRDHRKTNKYQSVRNSGLFGSSF